jgi:uncharacterized protein
VTTYWAWWAGGLALASVGLLHWLLAGRLMSVSSRFTGLVDRARRVRPEGGAASEPLGAHLAFFGGVAGGGLVAAQLAGQLTLTTDPGETFARLFGGSPLATGAVLLLGGVLVGYGTRMARGCTSGHGLCGVARLERGSLLATVAFFGTGVVVSALLGRVLG